MSFQDDLNAWVIAELRKLVRRQRIPLTRLIRGLIGPQPRDLTPGAARPGERFASRRPVPNAAAGTVFAYLESGLATFSGSDDDGALVTYHSALAASVALRQADDLFGLVGNGFVRASDGASSYPPMPPTDGVDFVENSRSSRVPWNSSSDYIPASTFSGHLMQLWVQSKYGSDSSVSAVSLFSTTIGGATVSNTAAKSNWIYEHEDAERIEWWGIEANSGGALKAGLMVLDTAAERLSDYLLLHTALVSSADRDWLRAWIFRGANWPASEDMIEVEATLPTVGGLGYGWHVSASGALASIHTYELVDTGSSPVHHGSEWTRWDIALSLEYVAGSPVWGADVTDTATGYLETGHYDGLTVWTISPSGVPAPFITDPSPSAPDPLASDAEVWGEYIGETWNGIDVSDTGTTVPTAPPAPSANVCESASYSTITGNNVTRICSVGAEIIEQGTYSNRSVFAWWLGATLGTTGSSEAPDQGPIPCRCVAEDNPGPEPPSGYVAASSDRNGWWGDYQDPWRTYQLASSMAISGAIALVLPIGIADSHLIVKYDSRSANAYQQLVHNGTAIYGNWSLRQVYRDPETGTLFESVGTYGHSTGNWDASGCSSGASGTEITTSVAKETISAALKASGGQTLSLWSSSGGTDGGLEGGIADDWQGSGTIALNGWLPYISTAPSDPAPSPLYAVASAVEGVLSGCTGPGCSSTEATDTSAASPMPVVPVWLGGA